MGPDDGADDGDEDDDEAGGDGADGGDGGDGGDGALGGRITIWPGTSVGRSSGSASTEADAPALPLHSALYSWRVLSVPGGNSSRMNAASWYGIITLLVWRM
jgi:hypothetical protein